VTIQLSRQSEVVQTIETQHWKYLQVTFDKARFSLSAKALEDLGNTTSVSAIGSPPSISSTQRIAYLTGKLIEELRAQRGVSRRIGITRPNLAARSRYIADAP
jgi:hypothetical protein